MIVFFYDNNQIVCILLLWMLLGGIGVPMATVSAQDVSTDSTGRAVKLNQVVISKRDMRMIVLRPTGDTLAVFRIACGRNYGHKQREWDCRTPEGRFVIASVEAPVTGKCSQISPADNRPFFRRFSISRLIGSASAFNVSCIPKK